jgi:hypothetical protein
VTHRRSRNRSNQVAGWLIAWGLLALMVLADSLSVYRGEVPDGPVRGVFDPFFAAVVAGPAVLSVSTHAFFAKPYAQVLADTVVVQNPLRRLEIAITSVSLDDRTFPYASLHVGGRRVRLWGAQRGNLDLALDRSSVVGHLHSDLEVARRASIVEDAVPAPVSHWSVLDRSEVLLLLAFLGYAVWGAATIIQELTGLRASGTVAVDRVAWAQLIDSESCVLSRVA